MTHLVSPDHSLIISVNHDQTTFSVQSLSLNRPVRNGKSYVGLNWLGLHACCVSFQWSSWCCTEHQICPHWHYVLLMRSLIWGLAYKGAWQDGE